VLNIKFLYSSYAVIGEDAGHKLHTDPKLVELEVKRLRFLK